MQRVVELGGERVNRVRLRVVHGPRARAHVAALDDEPRHHAVEGGTFVDAHRRQAQEVTDVRRGLVREELHGDVTAARLDDGAIVRQLGDGLG